MAAFRFIQMYTRSVIGVFATHHLIVLKLFSNYSVFDAIVWDVVVMVMTVHTA